MRANIVFKSDHRREQWLFPPSIESMIPDDHPVRFIDSVIDGMDISDILSTYKGGGTSSYHPRILIKILVYGYLDRIYSSRRLEQQTHENICYMWLSGMQKPDHVTISNFRSSKLKGNIKSIFSQVIKLLYCEGLIRLKTQTVDGTKFESVANRYTHVWEKNIMRFKGNLEQKIEGLLKEIDDQIKEETENRNDQDNGEKGYETEGKDNKLTSAQIEEKLSRYAEVKDEKIKRKIQKIEKQLLTKLKEYEQKEELLNGRNSYSKTDSDASFMRMKDDHLGTGQLKPAYNVQASSENQFIINYTIHQNANDASCYIDHTNDTLEMLDRLGLPKFQRSNADSIYGTESNYDYLEQQGIDNYLKYPQFHNENKPRYKNDPFKVDNLFYNEELDFYVCPMGQRLNKYKTETTKRKNGHIATVNIYKARNCDRCPLRGSCLKGEGNRTVKRNPNLERHKKIARDNLNSLWGIQLRKKRSVDVEPIFGHIKYNRLFNRFMLKGIPKINIELGLHAIAHNLKKMMNLLKKHQNNDNLPNLALNSLKKIYLLLCTSIQRQVIFIPKSINLHGFFNLNTYFSPKLAPF